MASLYGWLAYTIYDDFLDGDGKPVELSAAHIAQRQMLSHFFMAIPTKTFNTYVHSALARVDAANTWELTYCRAKIRGHKLSIDSLPDYKNLQQLADRSWCHSLAAAGCLLLAGSTVNHPDIMRLEKFFYHYLIARQLNDDAHDWEDDLGRGQLSAVVCQLIQDAGHGTTTIRLKLDDVTWQALRLIFWQTTIQSIATQIFHHITAAKEQLDDCPNPKPFIAWLNQLSGATQKALDERAKSLDFINTFQS